jgi:DNA gyrase subunit B
VPTAPLSRTRPTDETGTTITFWAEPDIFETTVDYDFETLRTRFQQMAFLNKGLTLVPSSTSARRVDPDAVDEDVDGAGGVDADGPHAGEPAAAGPGAR